MKSTWGMDPEQRLEQFSRAYIRAVAAVSGLTVYEPEVDDDSIDFGLAARGSRGSVRSPRLEIQVKGTGRDLLRKDGVHFPLKIKNYEDLRGEEFLVPRILVVIVVPREIGNWMRQTEEELVLRRCGYWLSLREHPPASQTSTVTVVLPRKNVFNIEALGGMMDKISRRETL